MTYLKLKNNRLRISLTKDETEKIFGNADAIDKNDPKTNLALRLLFKKAVCDNSFIYDYGNVWIEVAKNLSGGYDIYFTKSRYTSSLPDSALLVLEFSSLEGAITASKVILASKCENSDSRLYRLSDKYRMIVVSKKSLPAIIEFADCVYISKIEVASTLEHGHCIIKDDAIEILAKF
ncbi:MAG: adaptor protein MecA [Clostridia bacterium]|nr:adaptor protein MecA [Clostridia bacterium]